MTTTLDIETAARPAEATEAKATTEAKAAPGEQFTVLRGFAKGLLSGVMILSVGVLLAVLVVPRLIGAVPLTVLSGSMVPTFNPGDLIVTMPVDADEVRRGDVITFQPVSGESSLITHRVLSVGFSLNGETILITKGDANGAEDEPIIGDQVMGKYIYHIPYLGFLVNAIPAEGKSAIMQVLGFAFFAWAAFQLVMALVGGRRKGARGRRAKLATAPDTTEVTSETRTEVEYDSH